MDASDNENSNRCKNSALLHLKRIIQHHEKVQNHRSMAQLIFERCWRLPSVRRPLPFQPVGIVYWNIALGRDHGHERFCSWRPIAALVCGGSIGRCIDLWQVNVFSKSLWNWWRLKASMLASYWLGRSCCLNQLQSIAVAISSPQHKVAKALLLLQKILRLC